MRHSLSVLRLVLALAVLGLWQSAESVSAATDWCFNICDSESQCDTPCMVDSDPAFEATCGEYQDGASSGWCAGACEDVCSPNMHSGVACYEGSSYSSCGSFGLYLQCGDDFCGDIEGPGSCSADCGDPLFVPDDQSEYDDFEDFADTLDSQGSLDGSGEGVIEIVDLACVYGYIDSEWCPSPQSGDLDSAPAPAPVAIHLASLTSAGSPDGALSDCASAGRWGKWSGGLLIVAGVAGIRATVATGGVATAAAVVVVGATLGGTYATGKFIQKAVACLNQSPEPVQVRARPRRNQRAPALLPVRAAMRT